QGCARRGGHACPGDDRVRSGSAERDRDRRLGEGRCRQRHRRGDQEGASQVIATTFVPRLPLVVLLLVAAWASPASAEADDRLLMKLPQEIEYSGAPDQLQTAVIFGDPTKQGFYVERFRFPPGLKVPPHWHPDEMRTVVVISGTLYYAFGEQWDEKK